MATRIATGAQQQFWATIETAFDTVEKPTAAKAVPLINLDITPTVEFQKVMERTGTSSLTDEVQGKSGGTWSCSFYIKPNGSTVTVAPDVGEILKAAFGYENLTGDVSYGCHSSGVEKTEPLSLQFHKRAGIHHYEVISGCWVESVEFSITANEIPTVTCSGGFCSYGFAFGGTLSASAATGDTFVNVDSGTTRFKAGAYLQFNEGGTVKNNSGNFYKITSVDTVENKVYITPNPEEALDDDTTIEAAAHDQALTTNSPVSGVDGALSLGGTEIPFISASVTMATGIKAREVATQAQPVGLSLGNREVTGSFSCFMDSSDTAASDVSRLVGGAFNGTTYSVVCRAGADTAKARMKLRLPAARLEVVPVEIPEAEEATANISFIARKSSDNGDEISIDFD